LYEHKFNEVIVVSPGKTVDNVNHKIRRLGIVEEENADSDVSSSSNLVIPDELPRDKEPLKILYMNVSLLILLQNSWKKEKTYTQKSCVLEQ
jgi:hypothetical protein